MITKKLHGAHLFLALCSLCYGSFLHAHGGVSIQGNKCILSVGAYSMLFTGYQPKTSGEEFCDDIPQSGKTIIVLDFIDPVLRSMEVDYRVIKDVNNIGITATEDDLGNSEDIAAATLIYLPPKIHDRGTFMMQHDFQKGNYIGLVTIKNKTTGASYTSVLPFSVDQNIIKAWHILLAILLLFVAGYKMAGRESDG